MQAMKYNFDQVFPAPGTNAPMHKKLARMGITGDTVCYGTAEMKFNMLPEIKEAVAAKAMSGYLGYSTDNEAYMPALQRWMKVRHNWEIEPEEVINTHGVVTSIGISVRAFTKPGDGVIVQPPVYDHFASEVVANGRTVVENPLVRTEDKYVIDFDDFEAKAKLPNVKMFVMCSPHNPACRVWTKEELARIAKICAENGVVVISDEIHNDIVYEGEHTIFALVSPEAEQNCVVCTAPSKTFNVPAFALSNIIIKNPELRAKFKEEADRSAGHYMNTLGMAGAAAAFTLGDEWVDEMNQYVRGNGINLRGYLDEYMPQVWMPKMEGTYLAWLDFSFLGMTDEELEKFFKETVKLSVNCGKRYGTGGSQFIRVNIACPDKYVRDFVVKTAEAIKSIGK